MNDIRMTSWIKCIDLWIGKKGGGEWQNSTDPALSIQQSKINHITEDSSS